MQIETKTATFAVDDIQAAYNKAVLFGRMLLAREIEQLWLGALASQRSLRAEKGASHRAIRLRQPSQPVAHGLVEL
jgi:hypothetical protein